MLRTAASGTVNLGRIRVLLKGRNNSLYLIQFIIEGLGELESMLNYEKIYHYSIIFIIVMVLRFQIGQCIDILCHVAVYQFMICVFRDQWVYMKLPVGLPDILFLFGMSSRRFGLIRRPGVHVWPWSNAQLKWIPIRLDQRSHQFRHLLDLPVNYIE